MLVRVPKMPIRGIKVLLRALRASTRSATRAHAQQRLCRYMKEQKANMLLKEKLQRCAGMHRVAHSSHVAWDMRYAICSSHTAARAVSFCSGASTNRSTQTRPRGLSAVATH